MSIFGLVGVSITVVIAGVLLQQHYPVMGIMLSMFGGIFLLLNCMDNCREIVTELKNLIGKTQIQTAFFAVLLKALGICYICQFAGDLCRDAKETALAGYVELAGKITVVGMSFPLVIKVVETVVKLIEV